MIFKILFKDLEGLSNMDSLNAGVRKVSVASQSPRVGTGVSNWIKVVFTSEINLWLLYVFWRFSSVLCHRHILVLEIVCGCKGVCACVYRSV